MKSVKKYDELIWRYCYFDIRKDYRIGFSLTTDCTKQDPQYWFVLSYYNENGENIRLIEYNNWSIKPYTYEVIDSNYSRELLPLYETDDEWFNASLITPDILPLQSMIELKEIYNILIRLYETRYL